MFWASYERRLRCRSPEIQNAIQRIVVPTIESFVLSPTPVSIFTITSSTLNIMIADIPLWNSLPSLRVGRDNNSAGSHPDPIVRRCTYAILHVVNTATIYPRLVDWTRSTRSIRRRRTSSLIFRGLVGAFAEETIRNSAHDIHYGTTYVSYSPTAGLATNAYSNSNLCDFCSHAANCSSCGASR